MYSGSSSIRRTPSSPLLPLSTKLLTACGPSESTCTPGEKGTYKFWQLLHILSGGLGEEDFLALAWKRWSGGVR